MKDITKKKKDIYRPFYQTKYDHKHHRRRLQGVSWKCN